MSTPATLVARVDAWALFEQYQDWFLQAGISLAVLGVTYLLGRLLVIPPVVRGIRARNPNNPTLVDAVGLYLRVVLIAAALPIAVAAGGFGGIAASSGLVIAAATIALGVAGQDVIGNLVSGVFLVADPEFNVDDYIEWEADSGTVEQIRLRTTRIRTPNGEVVTVPNTALATTAIRRPFVRERYRVNETLLLGYDVDVEAATALLEEVATAGDRVLAEPAPQVDVTDMGGSAIEVTVRFWVGDPGRTTVADVRTDFDARAKRRLAEAGFTLAPPNTQELSGRVAVEDRGSGDTA